MKKRIVQTVAVLGSGVMGSQIAAHLANAGFQVDLLDLKTPDGDPDAIARQAVERLHAIKPPPLAVSAFSERIRPGNFDDHWSRLAHADWICEAVVERMDIKQSVMARIESVCKPDAIITSNTSGLPITDMVKGRTPDFRRRFLGTHFFNPPRYMKLIELIPTADTEPEVLRFMRYFCERKLGKGVVLCQDTPNFIANRIGVFSMASIMPWFFDGRLRAETIDWLTGTLTGYSKAATFRTADMAGNDVIGHVLRNIYPVISEDERRDVFKIHPVFDAMLAAGLNGNKTGAGFYKKTKEGHLVLNPQTMEYEPQQQPELEGFHPVTDAAQNLKQLLNRDDTAGRFMWSVTRDLLLYTVNRIPEISGSVPDIDRAMQWGFNWEAGPFHRWDRIGIREMVHRLEAEGTGVPETITAMLKAGREQFYNTTDGTVWNLTEGKPEPVHPVAEGALSVAAIGKNHKAVLELADAVLWDGGNGVGVFEVKSKHGTLGRSVVESMNSVLDSAPERFDALVIHHDGVHFSRGANLKEVVGMIQAQDWAQLEEAVRYFQETVLRLRYSPFPVVAAPFGQTLGGACEWVLHCDAAVAHHELYIGLVETGVGILPAGCGTKERIRRVLQDVPVSDVAFMLERIKTEFKKIAMATLSMSANEGVIHGHLPEVVEIVMNRDLVLTHALRKARDLADSGYHVPDSARIKLTGKAGYSALMMIIYIMKEARYISDYDGYVAERLAYAMTGGDLSELQIVSEETALKLEREAFLDLLHQDKTQQRIIYTLEHGKPLRN